MHSPYVEASSDAVLVALECIWRVLVAPGAQSSFIDEQKCATFNVGCFSHKIMDFEATDALTSSSPSLVDAPVAAQ